MDSELKFENHTTELCLKFSNVQSLPIGIYQYLRGSSSMILGKVFNVNETIPYDWRMRNELYDRNPKTVRYGTETISPLSPKKMGFDTKK